MDLKIYACGGAGASVVSSLFPTGAVKEKGYGDTAITFISSADNDRVPGMNQANTYMLSGVRGGGGDRSAIADFAQSQTGLILNMHAPAQMNIIVTSLGGATGSTLSYFMAQEILNQGKAVVVIAIGCFEDMQRTRNTVASMSNILSVPHSTGKALNVIYLDNRFGRKPIDENAHFYILALLALYSGNHGQIDEADLRSFAQPVGSVDMVEPAVYDLQIFKNTFGEEDLKVATKQGVYEGSLSTLMTLGDSSDTAVNPGVFAMYSKAGVASADTTAAIDLKGASLHYVTSYGAFTGIWTAETRALEQARGRLAAAKTAVRSVAPKPPTGFVA